MKNKRLKMMSNSKQDDFFEFNNEIIFQKDSVIY